MEVRLSVDDAFIKRLQDLTGTKATDITRDALTIYNWAVGEVAAGRLVLSTNGAGGEVHRLVMPALQVAETRGRQRQKELLKQYAPAIAG